MKMNRRRKCLLYSPIVAVMVVLISLMGPCVGLPSIPMLFSPVLLGTPVGVVWGKHYSNRLLIPRLEKYKLEHGAYPPDPAVVMPRYFPAPRPIRKNQFFYESDGNNYSLCLEGSSWRGYYDRDIYYGNKKGWRHENQPCCYRKPFDCGED